nr:type II toxin-antitoxin system RelE/ParE family toxin [Thioalkalivibrio sp.]
MRILWTDEALEDLVEIVAYYYANASSSTAESVERRIIEHVEALPPFPERIRKSDRIPGAHELVVNRLPYVVFVKLLSEEIVVLNVVHTARMFPR